MGTFKLPRGYLSASAINMLLLCPRKYECNYILDYPKQPSSWALDIGKLTHATFEAYYKDAMESDQRMTGKQAGEYAADVLIDGYFAETETTATAEEKASTKTVVPDIVSEYVDSIGYTITPKACEKEILTTIRDVPIKAYLDLEYRLPEEKSRRIDGEVYDSGIADYKITTRPWTVSTLQNSLQFQLYSTITGFGDVTIHNILKEKKVAPKKKVVTKDGVTTYSQRLLTVNHVFDGSDVYHVEDIVENAAKLITAGVFMPCSPDSWCCSEKWCWYWPYCRGRKG